MKKLTLLSGIVLITSLLGLSTKLSAQIILDQVDLPSAGLKVVIDSDGVTNPNPGIANISTPQIWDFSHLQKQSSKTDTFLAVPTKYASVFTTSNLCDSTYGGNGYNFFNTSPTNLAVVGAEEIESAFSNNFQIEITLNPAFQQSALPASISTNNINSGDATGSQIFTKSILLFTQEKFIAHIYYNDTVDAYGSMKMPNGYSYNVLRQRHAELDVDSVFGYTGGFWVFVEQVITNKNQYDWYAKGVGFVLAEEDMSTTWDTIVDVKWDTTAPAPSAINQLSLKNNVVVYPNPANSQITFITGLKDNGYVSVYDITGRELDRIAVKNGDALLNTSNYTNGIYLYNLTDIEGNVLDRGKFTVQH